jgi:hypothetical protein
MNDDIELYIYKLLFPLLVVVVVVVVADDEK